VFAITGMPWPSIIFSAVLIGVAIWSQRNVVRWANAHNAKVAPGQGTKRSPTGTNAQSAPTPTSARPATSQPAKSGKANRRS